MEILWIAAIASIAAATDLLMTISCDGELKTVDQPDFLGLPTNITFSSLTFQRFLTESLNNNSFQLSSNNTVRQLSLLEFPRLLTVDPFSFDSAAFSNLETLQISGTLLQYWPITNLSNLVTLNLSNNRLVAIPEISGKLNPLQALHLNGNHLTNLSYTFLQSLANSSLSVLNLANNNFTEIPDGFELLANLTYLNLSSNQISGMRKIACPPMQVFSIMDNLLTTIPAAHHYFLNLTLLEFSRNKIQSMQDNLFEYMPNVETFLLDDNQLSSFPTSFTNLHNLKTLNINRNNFTSDAFSKTIISNLPSLSNLFLDNNVLQWLPDSFQYFNPNLSAITISLQGNHILCSSENLTWAKQWLDNCKSNIKLIGQCANGEDLATYINKLPSGYQSSTTTNHHQPPPTTNHQQATNRLTVAFPIIAVSCAIALNSIRGD